MALQKKWVAIEKYHYHDLMTVIVRSVNMVKVAKERKPPGDAQHQQPVLSTGGAIDSARGSGASGNKTSFNHFVRGIQGSLKGNGKNSPACFGKKDLSGKVVRLARLMAAFQNKNKSGSFIQTTKVERDERRKKEQVRREAEEKSSCTMEEEPLAVLVATDVRRSCCLQMLVKARAEWVENARSRTLHSGSPGNRQEEVLPTCDVKFDAADILNLLRFDDGLTVVVAQKKMEMEREALREELQHVNCLYTRKEWQRRRMYQQIKLLLKMEVNRAHV